MKKSELERQMAIAQIKVQIAEIEIQRLKLVFDLLTWEGFDPEEVQEEKKLDEYWDDFLKKERGEKKEQKPMTGFASISAEQSTAIGRLIRKISKEINEEHWSTHESRLFAAFRKRWGLRRYTDLLASKFNEAYEWLKEWGEKEIAIRTLQVQEKKSGVPTLADQVAEPEFQEAPSFVGNEDILSYIKAANPQAESIKDIPDWDSRTTMIQMYMQDHPEASQAEVARRFGIAERTVRFYKKATQQQNHEGNGLVYKTDIRDGLIIPGTLQEG